MSSCTNDDMPVDQSITFKINPATVVSSLVENSAGDLSTVDSDSKLYVSLYIYNKAGNLVASETQKFSDYTHIMNSIQKLEDGDYTIVTSTHIEKNDGMKYWNFSGQDNLSTFSVSDEGYIGGASKILGLTAKQIQVSSATKGIAMSVECAGAVALIKVMNWNRYSDVSTFGLMSNKSCDNVTFDYNGKQNYSIITENDYNYWMTKWTYSSGHSGGYGYCFMFPYTNINMSFVAITASDSRIYLGEPCNSDIEIGHTYLFTYDVTSEKTYWYDVTVSTSSKALRANTFSQINNTDDNLLNFEYKSKAISIVQ